MLIRLLMIMAGVVASLAHAVTLPATVAIPGNEAVQLHIELAPLPDKKTTDLRPLNTRQLTSLSLRYKDKQGRLVPGCRLLAFDAQMPAHRHGMSVVPQLVDGQKLGEYVVHGVKLHMAGRWELQFTSRCDGKTKVSTFLVDV